MKELLVLVGLPGAGKSTYANNLVNGNMNWKRVCRDDLRFMFNNKYYTPDSKQEEFITSVEKYLVSKALTCGYNVVVDATNLSENNRVNFKEIALLNKPCKFSIKVFEEPLNVLLERESNRENIKKVTKNVILDKANKINMDSQTGNLPGLASFSTEFVEDNNSIDNSFDRKKPGGGFVTDTVICDLDGTLALLGERNPYDASTCESDRTNKAVQTILYLVDRDGSEIIFVTARDDKYEEQTRNFLNLYFDRYKLYMRKTGDTRKDAVVKKEIFLNEIYPHCYVWLVLEDRKQVVDMWRSLGLNCFQVADGDF